MGRSGAWHLLQPLATAEEDRVSMLVRLAPGAAYPPHRHAGIEELYLLDGELMIDDKTLHPGDYNRALPGTGDRMSGARPGARVFSSPPPGTSFADVVSRSYPPARRLLLERTRVVQAAGGPGDRMSQPRID